MKTIFFVDDDLKRISSYVNCLEEAGYEVLLETNSNNVLNRFLEQRDKIHVVVMDMMMPAEPDLAYEAGDARRTGLYLIKGIRNIANNVPIIVFTVVRDPSLRKEIEEEWKIPYLEKPLMPSRLVEEIEKKLGECNKGLQ